MATDTAMTSSLGKLLDGLPRTPIERVAATALAVATNTDPDAIGRPWLLVDGGEVERLHNFELNEGIYETLNTRLKSSFASGRDFKRLQDVDGDRHAD